MTARLVDPAQFGPWAVITGGSAGIGLATAKHLAASGVAPVLVARRPDRLARAAAELSADYGVDCRTVALDLSRPDFLDPLRRATDDLDVGLFVGNAGFANPGELLRLERDELLRAVQIKVSTNLVLVHHFGNRLLARRRGGLLLVSSIGGLAGVPYVSNTAGVEAYVLALGEGLHVELARHGLHVTVLRPGPTETESMAKMGVDPADMPLRPMSADEVARQGLRALQANRPTHVAGAANRLMARLLPRRLATTLMGTMIGRRFAAPLLEAP
ncbi:MAG: SDR family NAD(P)-dependent oxidoreductase [Myxococcota bacterium]